MLPQKGRKQQNGGITLKYPSPFRKANFRNGESNQVHSLESVYLQWLYSSIHFFLYAHMYIDTFFNTWTIQDGMLINSKGTYGFY